MKDVAKQGGLRAHLARLRSLHLTSSLREIGVLHAIALCVVLALDAGSSGCGLRTPVRPPEDTAPVIPGAVETRREGTTVLVRWKRAERSADGLPLTDLASFLVERKRDGEDAWQRIITIDVIDQEKIRRREDFSHRDEEAGPGPVSYRVIAVTADGQEGDPSTPATALP